MDDNGLVNNSPFIKMINDFTLIEANVYVRHQAKLYDDFVE